jgi:hypothetical protein
MLILLSNEMGVVKLNGLKNRIDPDVALRVSCTCSEL